LLSTAAEIRQGADGPLENHQMEDIPAAYRAIGKKSLQWEFVTHFLAFMLILLMVFKPIF
jgi:hypothetical protein